MHPLLPATCMLVMSTAVWGANLLQNGSFEAEPVETGVFGWSLNAEAAQQKVWLETVGAQAGKQCLALRSVVATPKPAAVSQDLRVEPGKRYALTVWLRRDSVVYGTSVKIDLLKDGKSVDRQETEFRGVTWSPVCLTFGAGEATTARVSILTPNTGTWRITVGRTLYIDEASLVEVDPADNLEMPSSNGAAVQSRVQVRQTGPYYLWARVLCPGTNTFTLKAAGKTWDFHCYTQGRSYWVRPILPELILTEGTQDLAVTSAGQGIQIEKVVLTTDPYWKPEGARGFLAPAEAKASLLKQAGSPGSGSVELTVTGKLPPGQWGITQGVPFPQGALREAQQVRIADRDCQAETLARWPDGSVKWLLVSTRAADSEKLKLEYGPQVKARAAEDRLKVAETPEAVEVDTGKLRFSVPKDGSALLAGVECGKRRIQRVEGRVNWQYSTRGVKPEVTVEEAGPVRVVVRLAGAHQNAEGAKLLDYVLRVYAYAGADYLELEHCFVQSDTVAKVQLKDVALRVLTPSQRFSLRSGSKPLEGELSAGAVTLTAGLTSDPKASNDYPYKVTRGEQVLGEGKQASGSVVCDGLLVEVADFWQNAPRSLRLSSDRIELGLVGGPTSFYTGMAKTSRVLLSFGNEAAAEVFSHRPLLLAAPEWYCSSGALDSRPSVRREGEFPGYEQSLDQTLASWMKQYQDAMLKPGFGGMLDYGCATYSDGGLNMETALDEGAMVQFLRTGRREYFDFAELMIGHYTDIDLCHAGPNAGLIYEHGPHSRKSSASSGAGVNGHSWYNGVAQYACFTGARRILETAPLVGHYYARYPFPQQPNIHYWRQIGWKLMDLVQAYQLTGDVQHLEAALDDVKIHEYQRDHLITLWPYMYATGMKALRMYLANTQDPEVRELYLQLMDGFLHLRERPDDTVNGEWPKAPGMLLGNFPNDRSCLYYNEAAQASWLSGDPRCMKLAAEDLNWQLVFGLNDPTLLCGSSDLVRAMQEAKIDEPKVRASLPRVVMTPWTEGAENLPQFDRPTIVFQVKEAQDQAFEVVLFKSSYRKYSDDDYGRAVLCAPDGKKVCERKLDVRGLNKFTFPVAADGQTGVYTLVVSLESYWRWTLTQVDLDLKAGRHTLGVRPRYDRVFLDRLCVAKAGEFFPWLEDQPMAGVVMIEAEAGPVPADYVVVKDSFASGGACLRATKGDGGSVLERTFEVPADGTYRLFARVWRPYSDLLNVTVDGQGAYQLQAVHDMDNNSFPVWSLGCSLGEESIVRYWRGTPRFGTDQYSAAQMSKVPAQVWEGQ